MALEVSPPHEVPPLSLPPPVRAPRRPAQPLALGTGLEDALWNLACYVSWKHIRSSNVLELSFREVKRMTNVIGRFPTETAALSVVFGVLQEERMQWRRARMKAEDIAWIEEAVKLLDTEPITVEGFQALVA